MEVTIEKIHFEPYPIKDMVTAWEIEDVNQKDFLKLLKENTLDLQKVFDNPQDWNYDVANANIYLDGKHYGPFKTMPYFNDIKAFIRNIDWVIQTIEDNEFITVEVITDEPEYGTEEYFDYHDCYDAIGGDWEG